MLVYVATYPRSGSGFVRTAILRTLGYPTSNGYTATTPCEPTADPDLMTVKGRLLVAEPSLKRLTPETRKRLAQIPDLLFVKTHERPYAEWCEGESAIQMVRHPGAAMNSFCNLKRKADPALTLEKFVTRPDWAAYHREWLEADLPMLRLRYEDMYDNPELIDRIAGFVGVEPVSRSLETAEQAQARNPERNPGLGVDGWRTQMSPAAYSTLARVNGEVAERLGYDLTESPQAKP